MGTNPTKAAENPYCKARKTAAKYNDKLYSREGAAELLGVSVSTVSDYELNITKNIPVDMVVKMADLYHAPELKNYYCTHECPIGRCTIPEIKVEQLDRLTIKVFSSFKKVTYIKDTLLAISEDGVITEEEFTDLRSVIECLETISKTAQELKLYAEKLGLGKDDT